MTTTKKKTQAMASGINTKWFLDALKEIDKSQADLARHLSVSPSQVSKLFAGERRVQLDEVESIATFLNRPIRDVLINLGLKLDASVTPGPTSKQVPIVGRIEADGVVLIDLAKRDRMIDPPGRVPPGTAAVVVPAALVEGRLAVAGLYFFVVPDKVDPAAIGRLAIVRMTRGPWLLRTVAPGLEPGTYDLQGPAGREESQTLIAAGPILLIRP